MNRAQFTEQAPGRIVAATDALGNTGPAFLPAQLPPQHDFSSKELRRALSRADQALARLDGVAGQIERPDLLFRNYLRREAVLSSRIEGTRTTLAGLALFEAAHGAGGDRDAEDVANYVKAFNYGRERCSELPVGRRLFGELHEILMGATDPRKTTPVTVRDCLVVIGEPPLHNARFVPPPQVFVEELLENLERYLAEDDEPPLIKLAVAHYQFEAIHPFRDGNGRIGRLMISLWLQQQGILTAPMLYLSAYLERQRTEYYDKLLRVSTHGAWDEWIAFFLEGIRTQSEDAGRRTQRLVELRKSYHDRLTGPRVPQNLHRLVDELFSSPVLSVPMARDLLGVTYPAAKALIEKLIAARVLNAETVHQGGTAFYLAGELLAALDSVMQ